MLFKLHNLLNERIMKNTKADVLNI